MMGKRTNLSALFFICLVNTQVLAASSLDLFSADTLWRWNYLSDPRLSPDKSQLAYVKTTTNKEKDAYNHDIWLYNFKSKLDKAFSTHPAGDSHPRWSPSGQRMAFLTKRSGIKQIYIIDMQGGEARQLTEMEKSIDSFSWSHNGRYIAFRSASSQGSEKSSSKPLSENTTAKEIVIDSLKYRLNGLPGYHKLKRHLWVVATAFNAQGALPEAKQISRGDFDDGKPVWSADDQFIYFSAVRGNRVEKAEKVEYLLDDSEIFKVSLQGGNLPKALTDHRGPDGDPLLSPDGKWLAFTGFDYSDPPASYQVADLYIMRPDGRERRKLTASFKQSVGDRIISDVSAPHGSGQTLSWSSDSKSLLFVSAHTGRVDLYQVDIKSTKISPITELATGNLKYFTAVDQSVVVLFDEQRQPADLYAFKLNKPQKKKWNRLTSVNQGLLDEFQLSTYESFRFESFDLTNIQGWLIKPANFNLAQSYPLILYIHGGPHNMYGSGFMHEFQVLAQAGFVVLFINPRGSAGYGSEFGNMIQYRYPGDDYRDLMSAVDLMLQRPYLDKSRLYVTGGSGGGLLTSWTVGHTNRFKAAVSQRSVNNWYSFVTTTDSNLLFVKRWFKDFPWKTPEKYLARSPISYIDRINTPLMIIHAEQDYRVPLEQAIQLYTGLKMLDKEARLVIFPNEDHNLSRQGKPSHRIARITHILDWFTSH